MVCHVSVTSADTVHTLLAMVSAQSIHAAGVYCLQHVVVVMLSLLLTVAGKQEHREEEHMVSPLYAITSLLFMCS